MFQVDFNIIRNLLVLFKIWYKNILSSYTTLIKNSNAEKNPWNKLFKEKIYFFPHKKENTNKFEIYHLKMIIKYIKEIYKTCRQFIRNKCIIQVMRGILHSMVTHHNFKRNKANCNFEIKRKSRKKKIQIK